MSTEVLKNSRSLIRRDSSASIDSRSSRRSNPVSRSWSYHEDITKSWIDVSCQTYRDRLDAYLSYFTPTKDSISLLYKSLMKELETGLILHRDEPLQSHYNFCSVAMLDTHIKKIPTGREEGVAYAVMVSTSYITCSRIHFQGHGKTKSFERKRALTRITDHSRGLMDPNATATELFDTVALLVKEVMSENNDKHANLAACFCFPCDNTASNEATLRQLTKTMQTGKNTEDPVEGVDLRALLECAFARHDVNAAVKAITNDTCSTLVAAQYRHAAKQSKKTSQVLVGLVVSSGVNGCYARDDLPMFGYKGSMVNTELGNFNKDLPLTDVDLQVDYADQTNHKRQLFEKLAGSCYLGETCRRAIVKIWQSEAPPMAWVRQSLPPEACAHVVMDTTEDMVAVREILKAALEWEPPVEDLKMIKKLFTQVFERSASLVAVAIAALAKNTGRLQAAFGGIVVAVRGNLYCQNRLYSEKVRKYLRILLDDTTASLITIIPEHSPLLGTAVLCF